MNFKSHSLQPRRPIKEPLDYSWIRSATLAYKAIKKSGEFVLPGFGKLVKQKRKARTGVKSQDATEDQDSSQDRRQIPSRPGGKGCNSMGKEIVPLSLSARNTFRLRCVHVSRK